MANIDGNGMPDDFFAETFVLLNKIRSSNNNEIKLNKKDMQNFDIKKFCSWLEDCLDEIINGEEIQAWWKK